jgi:DNA-binding transcriptional regulator YiaG
MHDMHYAPYALSETRRFVPKPVAKLDWKAVGERLRQLRGFRTNQADFARELRISQSQLSRYETGESEMGAEVLLQVTQKCGKSIEWLLTGKDG